MNRRQPGVSRAGAVVSFIFKMVQERPDQRSVEVTKVERAGCCPGALMHEGEEQTKRVSIGGHGVRTGLALIDKSIGEERL